ncbi:hypothetical protein QFC21_006974 [Naganishia friedmannii]|uniref:Uncharacterized protein n=1 Tax=Naganishia friedmannii TaxID=89922 RepID=A0ACC2UYF9_9TREE|nr:hypothetical protein QFC21_006974 [Naganishia friedmannii]
MPARDPSATPMAHLSLPSPRHHHQQQHPEAGLSAGGAGRRMSTASEPRPVFPFTGSKLTEPPEALHSTERDPETGRSHSISTPSTGTGGKRKSLWHSISSGITSANGNGHGQGSGIGNGNGNGASNGPTRRTSEDLDHAGSSGVFSQGSGVQHAAGGGGSGWFSNRDDESMHSEDALYPAATTSAAIRDASMGLAASLSYSSSHSRDPLHSGASASSPHPDEHTEETQSSEEEERGLQTIKESSRSSSAANLMTPRANPAAPLAGLPDDDDSAVDYDNVGEEDGDDSSPKHGSLGSASNLPSGLSVMLSRSSASPGASPNKRSTLGRGGAGGTDQLASGASGAVGALLGPVMDAQEEREEAGSDRTVTPASETDKETGSSVASSVTVRPSRTGTRATSPPRATGTPQASTTTERTPLLQHSTERNGGHVHNSSTPHGGGNGNGKPSSPLSDADGKTSTSRPFHNTRGTVHSALVSLRKATLKDVAREVVVEPVKLLPATVLGCLLNVLDGVSYGMIMFPASPVFDSFGSLGVSMFFVSCIVSQLTYTLGGSIFKGGNGSMMIEAVVCGHHAQHFAPLAT